MEGGEREIRGGGGWGGGILTQCLVSVKSDIIST